MSKRSYTLEDKYKAAAALVASGTAEGASRQTGIPVSTIRTWGRDEEFRRLCQEIRAKYGDEIKGNLAQIVKEGTEQIRDRINNGDHVFNKKGDVIRKPMSGRDLTIATGTMFDKLRVLEGQPTHIVRQEEGLHRLRRLAHLSSGLDEATWWKQLPDTKKLAYQKAADKIAALAPDGAAVDPLKYLKLEALEVQKLGG